MPRIIYCDAFIVNIYEHTVLVQYETNAKIHRRYIPRELFNPLRKNQPTQIPCEVLKFGIEYSNVDLEAVLGDSLGENIQVSEVEQACRRAGIWLREDYRKNIQAINKILVQHDWRKFVDAQTIVNAALLDNP